ncbi:Nitronate monooxygenase [Vibrio ruber DSM 16370]|uniref:Nitronate monooxygenase n=1 Tax=Vibrio ruber (strain DSM 16370 / JCM 11486 / BCRC 17186 / CECT 7878 / LMG 23124 / VR1) TaxID=1123498 RepID=A0A1R4LHN9_VIBR1|nr:nitronate monooxygenase [Vibrio ruber]SJN56015.1 Nitronate monooxygenase [Vibrio ruber DSM 16370]
MKQNPLTSRLNIHPIIQAPMAGISTPSLAAAVSNAGALGSIALGASDVHQADILLKETKKLTTQPFNVNLFCHKQPERDQHKEARWLDFISPLFKALGAEPPSALNEIYQSFILDTEMFLLLLKHKPRVISFHFGLPPAEWIKRLKEEGIFLIATATNLQEAKHIETLGVNAIVAQGIEAGGHRGTFDSTLSDTDIEDDKLSTADLVSLLVANVSVPIIAAGGIMNGKHINHFMTLGASAAQLGTAFITCPESAASQKNRDMLLSERNQETILIEGISGRAARGLCNKFTSFLESAHAPSVPDYPLAYDVAKKLSFAALNQGTDEYTAYWAGQGAPLIRELTAKQLVEVLILEMNG